MFDTSSEMPNEKALEKNVALDLWKYFSNLYWQHIQALAAIEIAVIVAWYKVFEDTNLFIANMLLVASILLYINQAFIIIGHRTYALVYQNYYLKDISMPVIPKMRFKGRHTGVTIPLILISFNLLLIIHSNFVP